MVKRIRIVISVLLCAVLAYIPLSGVKESFSVQNVEKSAMVKSMGFDRSGESTISYVQSVIDDSSAFHTQGLITAAGTTFAEAEKKAQILADKFLTLSYARHFLIGMSTAQNGIADVLSFLLASPVLQLSSYVYVCEEDACGMLEQISKDSISTNEVLTNLNLAGQEEGYYYPVTILELAKAVKEHSCIALPIIGEKEDGSNTAKKTVPVFKGYAVLKNNRIHTVLNRTLSRAYNLLCNRVRRTAVACEGSDFVLKNVHSAVHFDTQGEKVTRVRFEINAQSAVSSFSGASLKDAPALTSYLEKEKAILYSEIKALFAFVQRHKEDILHLEKELDIQSFGRIKELPAALQGVDYAVEIKQTFDNNFTLS